MKKYLPILSALLTAGSAATVACTINSATNDNGTDAGEDTGTNGDTGTGNDTGTVGDAGADASGDALAEAAAPSANIRFADWSPDAPSAGYDLCVAQHGTTSWQGPVLAQSIGDAGTLTFDFPTVTTYLEADVGQYDFEIVAAGGSCSSPIGTPITNANALAANQFYTLAIVGDTTKAGNDPTLTAVLFQDDVAPTDGSTGLRFVNVAPDLAAMDFGAGTLAASSFDPIEVDVGFATLASQTGNDAGGVVDGNGYVGVFLADAGPIEFSGHTSQGGTTDTATASNQTFAANSAVTLALVNGKNGGPAAQFLVCTGDGTVSTSSLTSTCTIVSM
jgi:hypothetical protein